MLPLLPLPPQSHQLCAKLAAHPYHWQESGRRFFSDGRQREMVPGHQPRLRPEWDEGWVSDYREPCPSSLLPCGAHPPRFSPSRVFLLPQASPPDGAMMGHLVNRAAASPDPFRRRQPLSHPENRTKPTDLRAICNKTTLSLVIAEAPQSLKGPETMVKRKLLRQLVGQTPGTQVLLFRPTSSHLPTSAYSNPS